jgi:hypothetical protein
MNGKGFPPGKAASMGRVPSDMCRSVRGKRTVLGRQRLPYLTCKGEFDRGGS